MFVALPGQLIKDGLIADHHWYLYIPVLFLAFFLMAPMMIVAIRKEKEKQAFIGSIALLVLSMLAMSFWVDSVIGIGVCMLVYFVAFNFLEATMPALGSVLPLQTRKALPWACFHPRSFLVPF